MYITSHLKDIQKTIHEIFQKEFDCVTKELLWALQKTQKVCIFETLLDYAAILSHQAWRFFNGQSLNFIVLKAIRISFWKTPHPHLTPSENSTSPYSLTEIN